MNHERLGCPSCGSEDELLCFFVVCEPVYFFTDGNFEMPEGITDYGDNVAIVCAKCDWTLGEVPGSDFDMGLFIEAHQEAVRKEFLKELQKSA